MNLSNLSGKLVVITGGSSGIGYEFAKQFCELGADVLLVARNQEKLDTAVKQLQPLTTGSVSSMSLDVVDEDAIERLKSQVQTSWGQADILINSAGIVSAGLVHEMPIAEWDRLHNTNVRGLVKVLHALLPDMINKFKEDGKERHILNVASAAGYAAGPGNGAYSATKAAVIMLSETLRIELEAHKIGVTALCPGFVKTPIAETVQTFGSMDNERTRKKIAKIFSASKLKPQQVAEQSIKAIQKNKAFVSIGLDATGGYWLKRVSPKLLSVAVKKMMTA